MKSYQTKQRKELLSFLLKNSDKQYTIEEISASLTGANAPGKSTVYRLMQKLVEEGEVKRFVQGTSRHFLYQATGGQHCDSHLHLKCTDCGRLVHLDEGLSDELLEKIRGFNEFEIDEKKTVLFGRCALCRGAASTQPDGCENNHENDREDGCNKGKEPHI